MLSLALFLAFFEIILGSQVYDPRNQGSQRPRYDDRGHKVPPPPSAYANGETPDFDEIPVNHPAMYDMENILTRNKKWPEFLAKLQESSEKAEGTVMKDWEEDAHKWMNWVRTVQDKEMGARETTTLRTIMRIAESAESPSPGMESYWKGAEVQQEQARALGLNSMDQMMINEDPMRYRRMELKKEDTDMMFNQDLSKEETRLRTLYEMPPKSDQDSFANILSKTEQQMKQEHKALGLRFANSDFSFKPNEPSQNEQSPNPQNRGPPNFQKGPSEFQGYQNGPQGPPNGPPIGFQNRPPRNFPNGPQGYQTGPQMGYQNGSPPGYQNGLVMGYRNGPPMGNNNGPPQGYQNGAPMGYNNGPPPSYHNGPPIGYRNGPPQNGPPMGYNNGPPMGYHNGPPMGSNNGPPPGYQNGPPMGYRNGPPQNGPPMGYNNGPPMGYRNGLPQNGPPMGYNNGPPMGYNNGPPMGSNNGPPQGYQNGPPMGYQNGPPQNVPPMGYSNGPPMGYNHGPPMVSHNGASLGGPPPDYENGPSPDSGKGKPDYKAEPQENDENQVLRMEEKIPEPVPVTPRPPPRTTTNPLASYNLPEADDFYSPVRWVKFNSIQIKDGLAKVTDPDTGTNRQYTINGTIYVPIIDTSKVGGRDITTELMPVQTTINDVRRQHPSIEEMKNTRELDWLEREYFKDPNLQQSPDQCLDDGCESRCTSKNCKTSCSGDTCTAGCHGGFCFAQCSGPGCKAMCLGEQCTAKCNGMSCDAKCLGLECKTKCSGKKPISNLIENGHTLKNEATSTRSNITPEIVQKDPIAHINENSQPSNFMPKINIRPITGNIPEQQIYGDEKTKNRPEPQIYGDERRMAGIGPDFSDFPGGNDYGADVDANVVGGELPGEFMFRDNVLEEGTLANNFGLQADAYNYKDFVQL